MQLSPCRHTALERTLIGYDTTKIPLIESIDSSMYPAGFTDDPGIYYFIPSIAHWLNIPINQAIHLFFYALFGIALSVTALCLILQFRTLLPRTVAMMGLLSLTALMSMKGFVDVYIIAHCTVFTMVPLFMFKNYTSWARTLILGGCGLLIGYSNLTRTHAGTGVLLFILLWLALHQSLSKKDKLIGLITLACGICIPYTHFHKLIQARDAYLAAHNPSYRPLPHSHPKWHSIYIGLGFIDNPYGITYLDEVAIDKVKSIDPSVSYCSPEYETILKHQCLQLLKKNPLFIVKNVLRKSYEILIQLLLWGNLGLLILFYMKPSIHQVAPFVLSIAFYCLPGILTIPISSYILGAISMTAILMIHTICTATENNLAPELIKRVRRAFFSFSSS